MSTATVRPARFTGFYRFVPALDSLRRYAPADARADVTAGLTVAAVAVPQAMAYAMVAGLPVEYGLYTAIVMTALGAIFGLEGEMFFGSAAALERHFAYIEGRVDETTHVVVLRMKRMRNPDAVGLTLLEGFVDRVKTRNVHVLLCGVRAPLFESVQRTGLVKRLDEKEIFLEQPVRQTSTLLAIRYAYDLIRTRYPTEAPHAPPVSEQGLYYEI